VGFRALIVREASALGLKGWVRNRTDGTVEAVVSGADAQVKVMVGKCTRGPAAARVTHIDLERVDVPETGEFTSKPTL
jgi:acylphosphatase